MIWTITSENTGSGETTPFIYHYKSLEDAKWACYEFVNEVARIDFVAEQESNPEGPHLPFVHPEIEWGQIAEHTHVGNDYHWEIKFYVQGTELGIIESDPR